MPTWTLPFSLEQLPFPVSLELLLIGGRAVALVGALLVFAWAFRSWKRTQERDTQRVFEQLDLIQGELHALADAMNTLAGRVEGLSEKVTTQAELAPVQVAGPRGYENAIRLAQQGAAIEEIVANCGLARHEAELLIRLHGKATTETASSPTRAKLSVVA